MKNIDRGQLLIYCLVAVLCVGSAFLISLKFIGKTHAMQGEADAVAASMAAQQPQAHAQQGPAGTPAPGTPPPPGAGAPPPANQQPGVQPPGGHAAGQPPAPPRPTGSLQGNAISELEGFLEPFIYDQVNRRDPFMPFAEYQPQETTPARPLSPAQRFDLDQLHLVGIMWDVREPKAMFMDPESDVLVLGRDEGIGNKNGYIAAIREGEVVVVEAIRKRGDIIYKTRVLRMER